VIVLCLMQSPVFRRKIARRRLVSRVAA
jgi:hypothetical protein